MFSDLRKVINDNVQKKYVVMFLTSIEHRLGHYGYSYNIGLLLATFLLILSILAILRNYLSPKLILFWYFVFLFAFFNASYRIKNSDELYAIAPQKAEITGQIVSIPEETKERTRFFFNVSTINYRGKQEKISGKTFVTIYQDKKFNIGDFYKIDGKLKPPYKVGNPSQFDYGKYLKNFNTFTTFSSDGETCIKLSHELSFRWRFLQGINSLRNGIVLEHAKFLKSPNLEILGGVVFGDDAVTPPTYIKNAFANAGILHILAASGMNVAIIYGVWFWILRKLKSPYKLTVISGICVVILYSLMTGLGASVARAMLMLIFILIGKLFDRDAHSISLLSFVGLLMLIYNPADINNVSFQLSFLATFGLLTTAPALFIRWKKLPTFFSGLVIIPFVAQIWVAPVQMFYFNTFSLYSILVNILITPFVSLVSFCGFASSVLAIVKPIGSNVCFIFDSFLNPILNCIVFIPQWFAKLPHSLLFTTKPNFIQLFLYYGLVLAITFLLKFGKNKKLVIFSIFLFVLLIAFSINIPNNNLETIAFDVQ